MPKNVAFFLPHFGHGGAEGVVLRLLHGMDRERFAPMLILQRREGELLRLAPEDVPVLGLRHPRLPRCIPELAQLYARHEVALAVTATNATNLYSVLAAHLAATGVRTLVTEHTPLSVFCAETSFPRLRRAAVRAIYPRATLAAGPLDDIGTDLFEALGKGAPPYISLPNPVVDHVGALRSIRTDAGSVVSVGRLAPEKRFDLLIDAFAELQKTLPEARLAIYGEGPERPALEARILEKGLETKVRLPGYTAHLDAVHGSADLFVCTSRREGLGNAMIEAMARGVPVVSVDCHFGPRRLLREGAAGRLVKESTPTAIALAMETVLRDAELRMRYVTAAFEVARDFHVERAVRAYEAAFDRAIAAARKPTAQATAI
jgi:glycosyltransferase involved in cell wall biosynthesis